MRLRYRVFCVSVLALSAALAPVAGQAGFEWVAPKEEASQSDLPSPQFGTPRISPQPLAGSSSGLDPLPPLSVDQESGTRATVYSAPAGGESAPAAPAPAAAPASEPAPAVSAAAPRLKTLHIGESAAKAASSQPAALSAGSGNRPQQLRMADKLVMPSDEEAGIAPPPADVAIPAAEGRVAINPAPLQAPAPASAAAPVAQPAFTAAPVQAQAAPASAPASGPALEGFGSDIPLVMALQQIVPPDYTYVFAGGVNPGESVSWEGGKGWTQVLNDMLLSKGLGASINGRSIQIHGASAGAPRAQVASSVNVAQAMAATAPAAGGEPSGTPVASPAFSAPQNVLVAPQPAPQVTKPVEKVAAVPPVYPAEGGAKPASVPAASVDIPSPQVSQKVLGRISDNGGLRVEDVRETVQLQGSPAAAQAARQSVTEHALGLSDQPGAARVDNLASDTLPSIKTTSYSVTKISRQVVADPKADVASAAAAAKESVAAPEKALHRTAITDPGETPSRQPEVQALNLRPVDLKTASAGKTAEGAAQGMVMAAASVPVQQQIKTLVPPPPSAVSSTNPEDQRKKLEDLARQQGVVLDAKSYSEEVLGKIFNNGIAPAAGESAPSAPAVRTTGVVSAPVSLVPAQKEATSAVASAAPVSKDVPQFWEAARGEDLQTTLKVWSQKSGVALVWKAARPYTIGSNVMVHGGFNDAIKTLFADGTKAGDFPVIRLNDGGSAQGTLVVEDRS